jgi:hypothetical protein
MNRWLRDYLLQLSYTKALATGLFVPLLGTIMLCRAIRMASENTCSVSLHEREQGTVRARFGLARANSLNAHAGTTKVFFNKTGRVCTLQRLIKKRKHCKTTVRQSHVENQTASLDCCNFSYLYIFSKKINRFS